MSTYSTTAIVFHGINNTENCTIAKNSSPTNETEPNNQGGRDEELAKIEIAIQAVILFLAVAGNSCVLLALRLRRGKLSRMHFFIMHLSIADLIVAFFNVFPQLMWDVTFRFKGGNALCKFVKFMQVFAQYYSTYVLVVTAIDRFQAICRPLSSMSWTSKKAHVLAGIALTVSVTFSLPQMIIFAYQLIPSLEVYDCWVIFQYPWAPTFYVCWFVVSVFIVPTFILIATYGCICLTVWQNFFNKTSAPKREQKQTGHAKTGRNGRFNPRTHSSKNLSNAKIKTVKLTLVVVISYIICWSPYFIGTIWFVVNPKKAKLYIGSKYACESFIFVL